MRGATWCDLKGALQRQSENQSALLKRAGIAASRCFFIFAPRALLICLMSTCQSAFTENQSETQPSLLPLLLQHSDHLSLPLLCGDNTHHLSALMRGTQHRCPYGPIQLGLAETCGPHTEPSPRRGDESGAAGGSLRTCELDDHRWLSPRFCAMMMRKH